MKKQHLTSITSLRFFAALCVFFHHVRFVKDSNYSFLFIEKGYIGVTFFFLLSGFVLSYSHDGKEDIPKRNFYLSRITRIYPLHILTLIISLPFVFHAGWKSIVAAIPNVFLIHSIIPIKGAYFSANGLSWSVSTEMFFYLLFPFLIKLNKNRLITISICMIASQIVFSYFDLSYKYVHAMIYVSPLTRLLDFILGILLYKCFYGKYNFKKNLMQVFSIFLLCTFLYVSNNYNISKLFLFDMFFIPPFLLIIYSFSENGGVIGRALSLKPLVILGEASFAFYLIHQLIIRYTLAIDSNVIPVSIEWKIGITFSLSIIASIILFFKFELPVKKYIRNYLE